MSLLPKNKPALVPIAPPSANDTYGTTNAGRDGQKMDGRKLRATGRTTQFNTRVTQETYDTLGSSENLPQILR